MIVERLPTAIRDFLSEVESLGFELTLVGGGPRDLILSDVIGEDLDFEIRALEEINRDDWMAYYQRLPDYLKQKKISFKVLPYLITRVEIGLYKLEFSSPRTEKNLENNLSHHHFEATLDSGLDFKTAFKRRDFTINAIGLKLNMHQMRDEIVDPWNGVYDLKNGLLRAVSEDFTYDSVRFLRLIRFKIKFDRFVLVPELFESLKKFNLSKLSVHHFKEEMFKSIPGQFLNLFNKLVHEAQLVTSSDFSWMKGLTFNPDLRTKEEILGFVFLQAKIEAEKVSTFFNLPFKCLRDLNSFSESWERVSRTPVSILQNLAQKDLAELLSDPFLKDCKNIEDKKIWIKHLHLSAANLPFGPLDWSAKSIDVGENNNVAQVQRSYLVYGRALKRKYSNG